MHLLLDFFLELLVFVVYSLAVFLPAIYFENIANTFIEIMFDLKLYMHISARKIQTFRANLNSQNPLHFL